MSRSTAKRHNAARVFGHSALTDPWATYRTAAIRRQGINRQERKRVVKPISERGERVLALLGAEPQTPAVLAARLGDGTTVQQTTSALYSLALRQLANHEPNRRGWTRA